MESANPPFQKKYKSLFRNFPTNSNQDVGIVYHEFELPLIDLSRLNDEETREECKVDIAKASQEWGFFQVVNHGISQEILERARAEQVRVLRRPFNDKVAQKNLNFPPGSYRWGTPSPISPSQLSWSESFHIPLTDFSETNLSSTMDEYASKLSELAQELAEILAEKLSYHSTGNNGFFQKKCSRSNCYLRMSRYPECPLSPQLLHGLVPHTDSDFLTVLHQDHIGGLQLVKDGNWIAVKPNQHALIINIGDLFEAWSNGVYRSVKHRVVTNKNEERFSMAYFLCPSNETVIKSCFKPSIYRKFTFGEYKNQVQMDVKSLGGKVGLSRFLV